jgi:class I fructose-bisphosphate aldolase
MSQAVETILSNYASETPGVIANLRRLLNAGALAGTGKLVILPVDQGFEHGPARSFAPNPEGYDPAYHPSLAVEAGCNAYAAPPGFIESIARDYAGRLPLILKVNSSDSLGGPEQPASALTGSVKDALRLGCTAIGFTIYPGSSLRNTVYQEIRDLISEARESGVPAIIWSYPRGGKLSKDGETAIDVVAYAAHLACQLGAHIVKVKPPTAHVEQSEAKKSYEKIPIDSLSDRVRHVVQSCFNGKRIVIFSGGATKGTEDVLKELREIKKGGGSGTIMGRNAFQRPRAEAITLLKSAIEIFK